MKEPLSALGMDTNSNSSYILHDDAKVFHLCDKLNIVKLIYDEIINIIFQHHKFTVEILNVLVKVPLIITYLGM